MRNDAAALMQKIEAAAAIRAFKSCIRDRRSIHARSRAPDRGNNSRSAGSD